MTAFRVHFKINDGENPPKIIGFVTVCANRDVACRVTKRAFLETGLSKQTYKKCVKIIWVEQINLVEAPNEEDLEPNASL